MTATPSSASGSPSPFEEVAPPMPEGTASEWLPDLWAWFVGLPLRIVLIVVVGALLLLVARRFIAAATDHLASGTAIFQRGVLRPLGEMEVASVLRRASPLASARRAQRARTVGSVLTSTASLVIGSIVVLLVLDALGLNLAPFIASLGIVGVAVGFGAQSLVKDVLSGLFMLLEDQYGVGDVVDVGPATGTVEAVGLRVTKVRDGDGTLWYVPNGSMVRVGNKTQGFGTAVVEVDVDYFVDLDEARDLLGQAAARVASDPALADDLQGQPDVTGAERLAADAVTLRLTVRTAPGRQWEIARRLRAAVRELFEDAGVPLAGQRDALEASRARAAGSTAPGSTAPAGPVEPAAAAADAADGGSTPDDTGHPMGEDAGTPAPDPHDTPVHEVVERRDPRPPARG